MCQPETVGGLAEVVDEESGTIHVPGLDPVKDGPASLKLATEFFDVSVHHGLVNDESSGCRI
jgi:hypothetical protein